MATKATIAHTVIATFWIVFCVGPFIYSWYKSWNKKKKAALEEQEEREQQRQKDEAAVKELLVVAKKLLEEPKKRTAKEVFELINAGEARRLKFDEYLLVEGAVKVSPNLIMLPFVDQFGPKIKKQKLGGLRKEKPCHGVLHDVDFRMVECVRTLSICSDPYYAEDWSTYCAVFLDSEDKEIGRQAITLAQYQWNRRAVIEDIKLLEYTWGIALDRPSDVFLMVEDNYRDFCGWREYLTGVDVFTNLFATHIIFDHRSHLVARNNYKRDRIISAKIVRDQKKKARKFRSNRKAILASKDPKPTRRSLP